MEIQNYSSLRITRNQWQNIKAVHEIFQYWPTSSLIKITLSFAIDFSGRVRPILCANEIAFQKASPVVLSNCSKPWVTIRLQKYWGACQHCETYFLALHGSNLHLVGCGREQKPHRWLISTETVSAFASVVSLLRSSGAKAQCRGAGQKFTVRLLCCYCPMHQGGIAWDR